MLCWEKKLVEGGSKGKSKEFLKATAILKKRDISDLDQFSKVWDDEKVVKFFIYFEGTANGLGYPFEVLWSLTNLETPAGE